MSNSKLLQEEIKAAPDALKVGDFVSWNSSGGRAFGKIQKIVRDGQINVPDSSFTIMGTEENPAALIRVYRKAGGEDIATDVRVGHRFSTLTKISEKSEPSMRLGAEVEWSDDEGDNIGIISDMMDGEELIKVKKYLELEGTEESDYEIVLLCEEVKLRTYTMTEKADDSPQEGSLVSWETSIGEYYGDILAITTDGMVRGEPQGVELEGTEERPVYAVRVHMWDDDKGEYFATNSMVVTYSDSLKIIDTIPEPVLEDPQEQEEAPNDGEKMSAEIYSTIESQIAEIVKNEVAKALQMISEVKANEQNPGELAGVQAAEKPAVEVVAEPAAEVAAEEVIEAAEEVAAEEVVAEAAAEEVAAEEVAVEEAVAAGEEKSFLTFQDLKEFSELIKVL
jgi:hypothetical protein